MANVTGDATSELVVGSAEAPGRVSIYSLADGVNLLNEFDAFDIAMPGVFVG